MRMNERGELRLHRPMPASAAASGWRWLPIAGLVIVLDQATKAWVLSAFREFERLELLPVLDFTLMYNTGAAFSFLAGASGWQRWFFVILALAVAAGIVTWLRTMPGREQPRLAAGLALILGGALGNVIDRLRLGKVVDFVHVHWNDAYFPAFNVADSAITIGACVLLLDALLESRRGPSNG
jgi:signal peptidase II